MSGKSDLTWLIEDVASKTSSTGLPPMKLPLAIAACRVPSMPMLVSSFVGCATVRSGHRPAESFGTMLKRNVSHFHLEWKQQQQVLFYSNELTGAQEGFTQDQIGGEILKLLASQAEAKSAKKEISRADSREARKSVKAVKKEVKADVKQARRSVSSAPKRAKTVSVSAQDVGVDMTFSQPSTGAQPITVSVDGAPLGATLIESRGRVIVKSVDSGTAADTAGVLEGMALISFNGSDVTGKTKAEIVQLIKEASGKKTFTFAP